MKRPGKTFGWKFFFVSTAAVVLSGILTVLLFFFIGPVNPSRLSISVTRMDHAAHSLGPEIGNQWQSPGDWKEIIDRSRRENNLAPVHFTVFDVEGRVLYQETADSPAAKFGGPGAKDLTHAQLVGLLSGKSHLANDWVYVVAPIEHDGDFLGAIVGDLDHFSHYQYSGVSLTPMLVLLVPALATIFVTSLASLYLARGLRTRLAALTSAIQAMAEGDYRSRLPQTADDEIGRVAAAFNRMADRLAEARASEAALGRLRRELITNVSHDLRGPLTSIRGYLEAIEDGPDGDPDTIRRYVGIVRDKSRQLARLVEDLLLYSRLESGDLPITPHRVEIADWLRESLAKVEPDLSLAGLELEADIPESFAFAMLDADRMDQVTANLAQNAVRYAPRGSTVHVGLAGEGDSAVISFVNEGPGLAPEDLPHVFERFYRGSNRADGIGAGLGLAIAARIVRAHGGDIQAENLPGRGVAFRFEVPVES